MTAMNLTKDNYRMELTIGGVNPFGFLYHINLYGSGIGFSIDLLYMYDSL